MAQPQTLEDLAFLYLACSHLTDQQLTAEEMRTIADRVHDWRPDATLEQIGSTLRAAVDAYKAQAGPAAKLEEVKTRALRLSTTLEPDQRRRVLDDLGEVAKADGKVNDNEQSFLDATAKTFGLAN